MGHGILHQSLRRRRNRRGFCATRCREYWGGVLQVALYTCREKLRASNLTASTQAALYMFEAW